MTDAYNELHTLAQSFNKPFDAPAILVVGHQTDGKSALIEALMGFQFNSVGGGTKTRRPIAINMKYNGSCSTPACFLKLEDGISEQPLTLAELQQAYIDADNAMLEREQRFASREIVVRMEYKHCPNLTIIDTPGLISPAPGKKNCALQACAAQVEEIVRSKAQVPEYVILCLEDCSDWSNATTRRLVMQVDPNLSRTVLVSTKFDTRIPQFARGADCEMFLKPGVLEDCNMLGDGPFFTSVPSGRVGTGPDCVFPTHDAFRERLSEREVTDVNDLEAKLGRRQRDHVGVGALRRFLEQLLQKRYLDAVPVIVPLLEHEQRATQQRLEVVRRDLLGLNPEQLKDKGRAFVDAFLNRLQQLLRGTVAAPADKWGETLADEHARGGAFAPSHGRSLMLQEAIPNSSMRLYGGAQFHRAMTEFRLVVGTLPCPELTHEDIVNACGLDYEGGHDGVNYVRTACVIAVSKAKEILEPYIHQLGSRLAHVLRRLLHISLALMQQQQPVDGFMGGPSAAPSAALTDQFVRRVSTAFHAFLSQVEESCKERCLEDLASTTRYVSWSLHTRNMRNLKHMLGKSGGAPTPPPLSREASISGGCSLSLSDMLETTLWNRSLTGVSEDIVRALVAQMFDGIRDHLVQAAELKFNCFFLMPLVDAFPARLRKDIECAYEEGLDEVFDAASVRSTLENRQGELQEELRRVSREPWKSK
ncbi:dynamin-related GTPase [Volvox carteri f. nagariensis]|uniref:Dynamin-related GTPase n=1 Tax=Volvox carteri f. nagariensis TaxID=3068 RepID=D8TUY9_VOLCA|nr:dynamin-related GTPase [Volvox carteri f. nagariensis]EFJ48795.1 dynamin-related GTPase [Volvox carteri f. nagariensis]|eukprot:XP_002950127.1 dynamin-related GTPase [Volvox carteri f. nagariensis]